ncbi:MAG TPA: hypothetical protein VFG47_00915, partial [Geminicoccaceae bacterium]|nr:hypothetical protein [Geminicoccaceae bacterium]
MPGVTDQRPGGVVVPLEMEVCRRIARGDGSTYRVNGREMRARDVQLLFADASSGARSAAIVGQGRIADLVQAKPTGRRQLLEEAAGISGLHARRHEAELRLQAATVNLQRVDDLLGTLQEQLRGLRRQARQAARYRELSAALREAEALLLLGRWREAVAADERAAAAAEERRGRRDAVARDLPDLRREEAELAAELARLGERADALAGEAERLERARDDLAARAGEAAADLAREESGAAEAARRLASLDAEREALAAEEPGRAAAL